MKKKLSLFLAVVMMLSLLPAMGVFASTENRATKTDRQDTDYNYGDSWGNATYAPLLRIKGTDQDITNNTRVTIKLDGATWAVNDLVTNTSTSSNYTGYYEVGSGTTMVAVGTATPTSLATGKMAVAGEKASQATIDALLGGGLGLGANYVSAGLAKGYIVGTKTAKYAGIAEEITDALTTSFKGYILTIYTDSTAQLEFVGDFGKDDVLLIPLITELSSASEAKVTIAANNNTGVTSNTYTFAYTGGGATTTTIDKNDTKFPDTLDLGALEITESRPGIIEWNGNVGSKVIKIQAPAGFEWILPTTSSTKVTPMGGFQSSAATDASVSGLFAYQTYGSGKFDKEVLLLDTAKMADFKTITGKQGTLLITGLRLNATDDAKLGDVNVKVSGAGINEESVRAGIYVEYGVTFIAEDKTIPEIIAGRYPQDNFDDDVKVLKVTFEEGTVDSWWAARRTTFKPVSPSVKLRSVKFTSTNFETPTQFKDEKLTLDHTPNASNETAVKDGLTRDAANNAVGTATLKTTGLEFQDLYIKNEKKAKLEMTFYVSVEPGFTGDIEFAAVQANVKSDLTATVAKAIPPFTVETTTSEVKVGYKDVLVKDFSVTETKAGAIKRSGIFTHATQGGTAATASASSISAAPSLTSDRVGLNSADVLIWVDEPTRDWITTNSKSAKIEVTDGDLSIEKITSTRNLDITVKRESTKASTFKVTGVTLDVDRTPPKGNYKLYIGGSPAANWTAASKLNEGTFDKFGFMVDDDFVKVITETVDNAGRYTTVVKATIGSMDFVSGDKVLTGDAAPYLQPYVSANGTTLSSTMVPVAIVAKALGYADSDVIWNPYEKSVTILNNARISKFYIGKNEIIINGIVTTYDGAAASIKDGRSFLPFRALGEYVLGCPVTWDEATQTAVYNQNADIATTVQQ